MEIDDFIKVITDSYDDNNKLKNMTVEAIADCCAEDVHRFAIASSVHVDRYTSDDNLKGLLLNIKTRKGGYVVQDVRNIYMAGLTGVFGNNKNIDPSTIGNWFYEYGVKQSYKDKQASGTWRNSKLLEASREMDRQTRNRAFADGGGKMTFDNWCDNNPDSQLNKIFRK